MGSGGGGGLGEGMPTHLRERLTAREAQRKAAAAQSAVARRRGDAVGADILLPPLNLPPESDWEAIFASPMHNTPAFFLEHMARATALLLRRIDRLAEECACSESAPAPEERTKSLDCLLNQIEEVQRWFTESSPHLKPFHVEQASQDIEVGRSFILSC